MESIKALRQAADELAQRAMPCGNSPDYADVRWKVKQLADAIESEVKANRVDAYTEGYDAGFASADDWTAQHEDAMAEHGWVRLPLDAEGIPIHIGDVMEWPDYSTAEVVGIGDGTFFYVEDGEDAADWSSAGDKIHHRAPTVEDVLREFALAVCKDDALTIRKDVVAEYAAKLRLAEGVDDG